MVIACKKESPATHDGVALALASDATPQASPSTHEVVGPALASEADILVEEGAMGETTVDDERAHHDEVARAMMDAFDAHDALTPGTESAGDGATREGATEERALEVAQEAGDESALPAGDPSFVLCKCTKCKLEKQVEGSNFQIPFFVCKSCNCKRSTCSQLFGYWPVEVFTMLPDEQQIAFWRSKSKGRLQIQNALVKEVVSQREEEQRTSVGGKYLPLDVWARKGFDPEKIKNECTDTEEHAMFGTCYNVGLKTVTKDDITKKVWKDLFKACGDESPKKKKDTKKKTQKKNSKKKKASSSSSSSSSDSSKASSSAPKLTLVEKRKAEAAKRKAAVAATKEQERLEKEREATRVRKEEAKKREADSKARQESLNIEKEER